MSTIRAFIAIELPSAIKTELDRVGRALAAATPRGAVRWVRPELMHLTLRFLGDTNTDQLPAVYAAMDAAAGPSSVFDLRLGGVGCFPNVRRPRVVWVGLTGPDGTESQPLLHLKHALDTVLAPLGWEPESKPFTAHLTLGRIKDPAAAAGQSWTAVVEPRPLTVSHIHLIESDLRPTGPVYTLRHSSALAGG